MVARIRKGDQVIVLTGRDRGQKGEVLKVIPARGKALVRGVNMVKKHRRPGPMSPGGIENFESPIDLSNLALRDPKDDRPTRVGIKILEDGRKVRVARRSGEVIDR